MSLVGLAHNICSKVVLSGEQNTRRKGRDAGNYLKFWLTSRSIEQKNLAFRVEGCCCG